MSSEQTARVLVVDDNPENRDLLSRRLARRGYETEVASGGAEALEVLAGERFDLVLLDVRMPGMDGLEVLQRIRHEYSKLDLGVLMVTAETDSAMVVKAIGLGANDYITKPIDFPVVLARVEAQLDLQRELAARVRPSVVVASSDTLQSGFVLDKRYEIRERIGAGGFAFVYRAVQLSTGQTVAVKVMRADRLFEQSEVTTELARFEREIKLIQAIRHPNIVRLIDSGHLEFARAASVSASGGDGEVTRAEFPREARTEPPASGDGMPNSVPYLVTEFLDGETLQAFLVGRGKLPLSETVDLMLPILSGVSAAHAASVVHRDLTPANIFLTQGHDGLSPRVLDFGIAKLSGDHRSPTTTTSAIVGTPNYMSPEQARGKSKLTPASDQYTLAVVMYECLTGQKPYEGESFISVLQRVARAEFTPPRTHDVILPADFEEVLQKAMSLEPEDRYTDTFAFARALLPFAGANACSQWMPIFEA